MPQLIVNLLDPAEVTKQVAALTFGAPLTGSGWLILKLPFGNFAVLAWLPSRPSPEAVKTRSQ